MTSLLWMLALLPPALTAVSELPKPVNDIITSSHFTHMLTWEPGPGSPPGVCYNVTVRTSTGTSWVPVVGCQHVQHPLVCNLTEAFSERYKVYRSRVTALLDAQESQPVIQREFKPIRDTLLDLPLLTVTPCGPDMCVELQPPVERLRDIYDSLQYKLLMSNDADKFQVVQQTTSLRRRIFKNLASGKWYCVSVCFSPGVVQRESNYSRPVCASTPGHYTADPWISSALCVLVVLVVVSGALWVYTRSTCRIDLPSVLKSIRHLQEALVIPSYSKSCILNVEPTSPSSGDKRNSQTSDESDGESVTGSTAGSSGGQYKMRLGNNLLSSSSASSSSSLLDLSSPEPNPLTSIGGQSPHTARPSDSVPTSQTVSGSEGLIPADEEDRKLVGEVGDHDVDLDTLTLGRLVEKVEQVEKLHHDWEVTESEVCNPISALPSLTRGTKEVAIGTVFCPLDDDEEEEEEGEEYDNDEQFGYMRRPWRGFWGNRNSAVHTVAALVYQPPSAPDSLTFSIKP
uniref:Fibronectin type-III domain-containing protein n=1 Tax=Gasterosteus aculeatus aculeatus TaxID=481459 RepID=G3N9K6_GASAC|nr:uncharacterized protein LOC120833783 isoform X2 [Gasterosteus aculeatus aculeatus]